MIARLRQATALPSILTSELIDSAKIVRAVDLAKEVLSRKEKIVIFSTFKDTVYELEKLLKNENPLIATGDSKDSEISDYIDKFQKDPNYNLFIGTWQKCGTGITLNSASYMIFIDTP
ncbi:helicase-related protein [uncultured Clostridium sp.]|uniref:helicase-related protein n=1 Tax=uncultured Clostridium sp. TaxID=59620 RepID=UPI00261FE32F|nr:C-terminal helicase domain-containing protein [uncultured Clostridium sp.]